MLKTLVLVCAIGTPVPDCSEATAIDVVAAAPTQNSVMCGLFGQAGIAPTSIKPEPGKSYLKIVCRRDRIEAH